MKIHLLAYSDQGALTAAVLAEKLEGRGHACCCSAPERHCHLPALHPLEGSLHAWAEKSFAEADGLIFCCAAGIAVRGIAPFVKDKRTDPAVVVIDEMGRFSISLLSGHLGGANELALEAAELIGAQPIITTATDLHGLFAVDVFAKKNHLRIGSFLMAKEVSAALLENRPVGIAADVPLPDQLPKGLTHDPAPLGIWISARPQASPFAQSLSLIPQKYFVGMGCKKGKDTGEIDVFFRSTLKENGIDPKEVRAIASIDLKKEEPGLLALSQKYALPFLTFSQEALNALPGNFSSSPFVQKTVGVDCVCERAAVCAGGRLILKKTALNGMTIAIAAAEEEIHFE